MSDTTEQPLPSQTEVNTQPTDQQDQKPKIPKSRLDRILDKFEEFTGSRQKAKLIVYSFAVMALLVPILVIFSIIKMLASPPSIQLPVQPKPSPTISIISPTPTKVLEKTNLDTLEEKANKFSGEPEGLVPPNLDNEIGL